MIASLIEQSSLVAIIYISEIPFFGIVKRTENTKISTLLLKLEKLTLSGTWTDQRFLFRINENIFTVAEILLVFGNTNVH